MTKHNAGDLVLEYTHEGKAELGLIKKVPNGIDTMDFVLEWNNELISIAVERDVDRYKNNLSKYHAEQS